MGFHFFFIDEAVFVLFFNFKYIYKFTCYVHGNAKTTVI